MCNNKLLKIFFILFSMSIYLVANPYEKNCKECHVEQQMGIFMNRYILENSSEKKVKKALFEYLKNPTQEKSVMPMGFLNRFGMKEKTNLDDTTLQTAIDIYYKLYAPKYRLK